jgi:hypothetical protein
MDAWGWGELQPWLDTRLELPVGPLLCVINGPTRGRHWSKRRRARGPAQDRRPDGRPTPLRAAPVAPRARRRARARGRAADRHPTPTRPPQSRHHVDLPARHRQRRNHRKGPRPPTADDPGQHIVSALRGTTAMLQRRAMRLSPARLAGCSFSSGSGVSSGPMETPASEPGHVGSQMRHRGSVYAGGPIGWRPRSVHADPEMPP